MRLISLILLTLFLFFMGCGSSNSPDVPDESSCYQVLDRIKTRGQPLSLDVYEDQLFVADNRNGLVILDISNPADLRLAESIITPERATVVKAEPQMNALFVSTNLQTYIYFLNTLTYHDDSIIGDAECRQILTDVDTETEMIRVIKADGNDGIQVSNVEVSEDDSGAVYFQKDDMLSLNWTTFIPPAGLAAIEGVDILAVGLKTFGVGIADLSEASTAAPGVWISNVDTPGEVSDVAYRENYLYAANGYFGLSIVDVTDINNPELVVSIPIDGYIHIYKVEVYQNHLILLDEYKGILFYDVSVPESPVLMGEYELREPYDAVYNSSDDLLYVSSLGEGITAFKLDY